MYGFWHTSVCGKISFVFTSNKQIKLINQEYLNHNYFTDVISFDYTEGICDFGRYFYQYGRLKIMLGFTAQTRDDELRRVMIHGVTHLLGFGDGTEEDEAIMRKKENEALHLWMKMV